MSSELMYSLGVGSLIVAYSDILKFRGSSQEGMIFLQLLFGPAYLVAQIWGFFVYDWWVPIFYVIGAGAAVGVAVNIFFGGPGLFSIIVGVIGIFMAYSQLL